MLATASPRTNLRGNRLNANEQNTLREARENEHFALEVRNRNPPAEAHDAADACVRRARAPYASITSISVASRVSFAAFGQF